MDECIQISERWNLLPLEDMSFHIDRLERMDPFIRQLKVSIAFIQYVELFRIMDVIGPFLYYLIRPTYCGRHEQTIVYFVIIYLKRYLFTILHQYQIFGSIFSPNPLMVQF